MPITNSTPLSSTPVTFEQAGGTGIGTGIGLSGKLPQFKDIYLEEQRRKRMMEEKEIEDLRKAEESIGKYLDIKGTHNLLRPEARKDALLTYNDIIGNYREYSNPEKIRKLMDFKDRQGERIKQSINYENVEAGLRTYLTTGGVGAEEAKKSLSWMQSGKIDNIPENDKFGIFNFNPETRQILFNPVPKVDINSKIKSSISDNDYRVEISRKQEILDLPRGGQQITDVTIYALPKTKAESEIYLAELNQGVEPEKQLKALANSEGLAERDLTNDINFEKNVEKQYDMAGKIPPEYWDVNTTPERKLQILKEILLPLYQQAGIKITRNERPMGAAPKEEKGKKTTIEKTAQPTSEKTINIYGLKDITKETDIDKMKTEDITKYDITNLGGHTFATKEVMLSNYNFYNPYTSSYQVEDGPRPVKFAETIKLRTTKRAIQKNEFGQNIYIGKGMPVPDVIYKVMDDKTKRELIEEKIFIHAIGKTLVGKKEQDIQTYIPFEDVEKHLTENERKILKEEKETIKPEAEKSKKIKKAKPY